MRKTRFAAFLLAAALLLTSRATAAGEPARSPVVLLVCSTREDTDVLSRLIWACRKSVRAVLEEDYTEGLAAEHEFLVTTCDVPIEDARTAGTKLLLVGDAVQESAIESIRVEEASNIGVRVSGLGYQGASRFEEEISYITEYTGEEYGYILIHEEAWPFAVETERETYAPYFRDGELSALLLGGVMQSFFGNPGDGRMYVALDEIYAFTDFYDLCLTADMLYENAIPFIVRVMPLYDNLDFPAFQRFAQVLRYLQAKNGAVTLMPPLVTEEQAEVEPLDDKMQRFYAALETERVEYLDIPFMPYPIDIAALEAIQPEEKNFGRLPIDTMINLSLPGDEEALLEMTNRLNALWLSVDNYRVNASDLHYQYREIAVDDTFVYVEEERRLFSAEFAVGNEILVVVVVFLLIAMSVILVWGARVYRRKFYKGNDT